MIKEVKIKTVRETGPVCNSIQKPDAVVEIWRESVETAQWFDTEKEAFIVFLLDMKNRVKAWNLVSLGTLNSSLVCPREVFRAACVSSAASVIVAHNHPSGDPTPSADDLRVTQQLIAAGKVLGIPVLDHIILGSEAVTPPGYVSLRDKADLDFSA
jgi:DNA repair protein RadC